MFRRQSVSLHSMSQSYSLILGVRQIWTTLDCVNQNQHQIVFSTLNLCVGVCHLIGFIILKYHCVIFLNYILSKFYQNAASFDPLLMNPR